MALRDQMPTLDEMREEAKRKGITVGEVMKQYIKGLLPRDGVDLRR